MKRMLTITLIFFCFICMNFYGCSSEREPKTEINSVTTTETSNPTDETIENTKTYSSAFKKIISDTYAECEKTSTEPEPYGRYTLYDFDGDNLPELFLEIYGTTIPDCYFYVYDFDGEKAVLLDKIQSGHSWLCGVNRDDSVLLGYWGTGGVQAWFLLSYENGEFQSEELASFYPEGFLDIEPQEDPLPSMGYEMKELKYYGLDDLSGLE